MELQTARRQMAVLLRHPSLFPRLPWGQTRTAKAHMELELQKAPQVYGDCYTRGLEPAQMIEAFQHAMCYPNSYMYAMCRHARPGKVVETGVHWGVSTSFVLQAMEDNGFGHLWSIDLPNVTADAQNVTVLPEGAQTGFLVPPRLRNRWTLILEDSRLALPSLLASQEEIDMFHHDSLHTYDHMRFEYETAWPRLGIGGLLLSDDVTRNDAFDDFCREQGEAGRVVLGKGMVFKSHRTHLQIADR